MPRNTICCHPCKHFYNVPQPLGKREKLVCSHGGSLHAGAYLIVLSHNHIGVLGEVEVEGGLVSAQVGHMEDEALIHTCPVAPYAPSHSRVHQPIPVTHP